MGAGIKCQGYPCDRLSPHPGGGGGVIHVVTAITVSVLSQSRTQIPQASWSVGGARRDSGVMEKKMVF